MRKIIISLSLFITIFILSCRDNSASPTPLNPNGDSELALLMREMFEDGWRMKSQIEKGEQPEVLKKFEAIHKAKATEPERVASDKFKVFADSYLATLEALQKSSPEESKVLYKGLVETCMTCHKAMCPGPIVKIKKLYLKD